MELTQNTHTQQPHKILKVIFCSCTRFKCAPVIPPTLYIVYTTNRTLSQLAWTSLHQVNKRSIKCTTSHVPGINKVLVRLRCSFDAYLRTILCSSSDDGSPRERFDKLRTVFCLFFFLDNVRSAVAILFSTNASHSLKWILSINI